MTARRIIAVIGAGACDAETRRTAETVGRLLAQRGGVTLTGGLGGVMEAASSGARAAGGLVIGILPGADVRAANAHVDIAIATGLGEARNVVLANTAEAFVAVGGEYGTLSEIAFALKRGKPVAGIGSWNDVPGVHPAETPEDAVDYVFGQS